MIFLYCVFVIRCCIMEEIVCLIGFGRILLRLVSLVFVWGIVWWWLGIVLSG